MSRREERSITIRLVSILSARFMIRSVGLCALFLIIFNIIASCEEVERTTTRGFVVEHASKSAKDQAAGKASETKEEARKTVYSDDEFVESEANRDPFRPFTNVFKATDQEEQQRTVVMPTTAIENMKLIAIITGISAPKAMLVDTSGVGHVVERGMYIGRPEIIRASENVSMTLNWRVHRIRENEVVLVREDPTDPNHPPLTRVIPLREENEVAAQ
jgi:type IV pilus assembly protein PilP